MRLVLIIITYLLFIPAGNTASFAKYKSTCSDIGFTPDTDPFADCVLKLYKRDKANTAEKNTSAFWLSLGAALTSMSDNMQKDLDKRNDDMERSYCESDCRRNQNGSQSSCQRMCK